MCTAGWLLREELHPSVSQAMEVTTATLATPHRPSISSDSLASAVDRHDGLCLGSPSDLNTADLRKTALMRSMLRRNEVCPEAHGGAAAMRTPSCLAFISTAAWH